MVLMALRRSPLFSAIVVAGASLTQAVGGCGGDVVESDDDASAASASDADGGGDASSDAKRPPFRPDGGAPVDAGTCPDGSDMPVPPCVLIK